MQVSNGVLYYMNKIHKIIPITCKYGKINIVYKDVYEGECVYLLYNEGDYTNPIGGLTEEEVEGASMAQLVALVERSQSQENPLLR